MHVETENNAALITNSNFSFGENRIQNTHTKTNAYNKLNDITPMFCVPFVVVEEDEEENNTYKNKLWTLIDDFDRG